MGTIWGIDLGGTKIEGVVLEPIRGETSLPKVLARIRIPTEADRGYEHIVSRISRLIDLLESESKLRRPEAIGIGTPGATEPSTGLMKNSNTECLNGQPLRSDLEKTLGAGIAMTNDANCFALAESTYGAAAGKNVVFGVILGTGVGGGVVVNGQMLNGLHGIGGEWGHNTLIPDGFPCYCGKRGCVEKYLSGPGAAEDHFIRTGQRLRFEAIAESNDPECRKTIDLYCERFGQALSVIVNILDPDAIVLGGGVGNLPELYTLGRERLAKHVFNPFCNTPLLKPQLGDSAGVFGAAMLTTA